jgi:protein gp37
MPSKTSIEWADYSWNPIRFRDRRTGKVGWHCEHASDGCRFCYSETRNRWIGTGLPFTRQNRELVEPWLAEARLAAPMPKKPSRIFVCDMTDLFAEFVLDDWITRIVEAIRQHPEHVYQVLTKRPERARHQFRGHPPPPNLWLGVSVEQRRHLNRLAALYATPVAIRFASLEPLLEDLGAIDMTSLDWAIAGAESDAWRRARPMQLEWVRHIRDQCIAAGVPFFFKQDAAHGRKVPLPALDGRQWRQFPIFPT